MKIRTAMGAAMLGLFLGGSAAQATDRAGEGTQGEAPRSYETEYGKALPPIGFVRFCARSPEDCEAKSGRPSRLVMSPERWTLLHHVNGYVNSKIVPVSDQDLYGQPEFWTYPQDAGDCEDFVLLKKRYLVGLGFPADALLITVVLDEKREGHAVLTVATDAGDYVLDNRRDDIMRWSDLDYTFLKRQSQRDPRAWVALARDKTLTSGYVAGGSRK
jgi:predicted transglutaminase-like cysteine proteinase